MSTLKEIMKRASTPEAKGKVLNQWLERDMDKKVKVKKLQPQKLDKISSTYATKERYHKPISNKAIK